jgi:hypothetical protein
VFGTVDLGRAAFRWNSLLGLLLVDRCLGGRVLPVSSEGYSFLLGCSDVILLDYGLLESVDLLLWLRRSIE